MITNGSARNTLKAAESVPAAFEGTLQTTFD